MITVGIIAEYNPFHNGHKRQIEAIRATFSEEVTVIALMSGNFVERGDLAIFPKEYRAKAAVLEGVDLVLEFPYPFSGAGAEHFARAGVSIFHELGVDYLSFGSESGNLDALKREAERVTSEAFQVALTAAVKQKKKKAFAVVREELYQKLYGEVLSSRANDILGVAYLAALQNRKSSVKPLVIKREGGESATASRNAILFEYIDQLNSLVPQESYAIAVNTAPVTLADAEKTLLSFLRLAEVWHFEKIADLPYDLACRMLREAKSARTLDDLIESVAGKTYTRARVRRALLSMLFGVTEERLEQSPAYTRLLAADSKGRMFLDRVTFPILKRLGDYKYYSEQVKEQVAFSDRCDAIYRLFDKNPAMRKPHIL